MNIEKTVAKNLLDIQAVSLQPNNPFTWASGIKSPIYCDNRLVLSFPEKRTVVVQGFVELIKQEYAEAEVIVGTATAGIPWGAMVADKLEKPFGYVRSSNKSHGKGNKIEGKIEQGAKVVVVEDLISTMSLNPCVRQVPRYWALWQFSPICYRHLQSCFTVFPVNLRH